MSTWRKSVSFCKNRVQNMRKNRQLITRKFGNSSWRSSRWEASGSSSISSRLNLSGITSTKPGLAAAINITACISNQLAGTIPVIINENNPKNKNVKKIIFGCFSLFFGIINAYFSWPTRWAKRPNTCIVQMKNCCRPDRHISDQPRWQDVCGSRCHVPDVRIKW